MRLLRFNLVGYLLPVLAIITLTVLLTLALLRLSGIQQDMRNNASSNMLWVVSQAQYESLLLGDAVYRRFIDPQAQVDVGLRYNLFMSRLNLLSEGPQARFLEDIGATAVLSGYIQAARDMPQWLTAAAPGDVAVVLRLQAILQPLVALMSAASGKAMVTQWEEFGARLDNYRNAVLTILFLMIGILFSSLFVSVKLLLALKHGRENAAAKLHAADLQKQLEAERKVSQLYRSFGAMVSHQFRTPLAIIDASMQRLVRAGHTMTPDEVARRANKARDATKRLTHLIESTLIADRISQKIEVRMQACDLLALASEAIDHQLAITPARHISLDADAGLLEKAWCDPVLTEHVLFNFISNAVKYSPESSSIEVHVFQDGDWLGCAVRDEGVGITAHDAPRIFDRYYRAETAADIVGTGMGLYVAQQLALMQHGQVRVDSHRSKGAVFELRLRSTAQSQPGQPVSGNPNDSRGAASLFESGRAI